MVDLPVYCIHKKVNYIKGIRVAEQHYNGSAEREVKRC